MKDLDALRVDMQSSRIQPHFLENTSVALIRTIAGRNCLSTPAQMGMERGVLLCKTSTLLVRIALVVFEILTLTLVERITGILWLRIMKQHG